jgi:hypothetical protein
VAFVRRAEARRCEVPDIGAGIFFKGKVQFIPELCSARIYQAKMPALVEVRHS